MEVKPQIEKKRKGAIKGTFKKLKLNSFIDGGDLCHPTEEPNPTPIRP